MLMASSVVTVPVMVMGLITAVPSCWIATSSGTLEKKKHHARTAAVGHHGHSAGKNTHAHAPQEKKRQGIRHAVPDSHAH